MGQRSAGGSDGVGGADDVDGVVAAWRRERPDLDVAPLEVLSRVSRLARHLDIARRRAFAEQGLEAWEFDVLSALRRSGDPYRLTPGDLLRETLVTSGTMTNRLDRLAERGLLTRQAAPHDRRAVLVTLTQEGRRLADQALEALLEGERELLAGLATDERSRLAAYLKRLLVDFEG
ncbi:MarR family winged helix-turn-helix transcriptional regulator [Ornithinimicrobium pekingense]|uniref:MarR family transcriptional regulator n=1 Tax=Ornithinimicrobium pekingense TaxID=384677 RepID=A0ABQ2FEG8_9MICO|nr:MarR family transcriptional regulator [Ornithinimicrobium pekingense]GGK81299.1 MarR family transcriptional regulator [Ornithinimicrobium pekingense]